VGSTTPALAASPNEEIIAGFLRFRLDVRAHFNRVKQKQEKIMQEDTSLPEQGQEQVSQRAPTPSMKNAQIEKPKTCLLAITGSVAAMKAPELVRTLQGQNFSVHCVLTRAAQEFVAPGGLAAITGNAVLSNAFFAQKMPPGVLAIPDYSHLHWAEHADVILVAPASADSIARLAHGRADGIFEAAVLATKCPVIVAPAMNTAMLEATGTQENIQILRNHGIEVLSTEAGLLACGDIGSGRLLQPELIALFAKRAVTEKKLKGKKVLITLGGTREPLDPVRFIGNASSGKMGIAFAKAAFFQGADVTVIAGSTSVPVPDVFEKTILVNTASEMLAAGQEAVKKADIIVFAAAVADFAPQHISKSKLESSAEKTIPVKKNLDIAAELGKMKTKNQRFFGFALETGSSDEALEKAKVKMRKKNLDVIYINNPETIGSDITSGVLFDRKRTIHIEWLTKDAAAESMLLLTVDQKK